MGVSEGDALELALLDAIATAPTPPDALILTLPGGNLHWEWNGPNPDHWNIQFSADGETDWATPFTEPGSSRDRELTDGEVFIRIVGADAGDNPVTPFSNVIFVQ